MHFIGEVFLTKVCFLRSAMEWIFVTRFQRNARAGNSGILLEFNGYLF